MVDPAWRPVYSLAADAAFRSLAPGCARRAGIGPYCGSDNHSLRACVQAPSAGRETVLRPRLIALAIFELPILKKPGVFMTTTTKRATPDACSLLDADHKNVKKMFTAYEDLAHSKAAGAPDKKRELAQQICAELTVHTQIEEEIFYPAVREAIKDTDLLDEAEVEHASAKDLIAQVQDATDIDEKFDAKVKVLGEYIDHHVKEERNELFPKARAARGLDLVAMRDQLAQRKEELMADLMAAA
jgi:hemerythrin superfamily protein